MQRRITVATMLLGLLALAGCVSEPPQTPQDDRGELVYGRYRYQTDQFTGVTRVTYWSFFFPPDSDFGRADVVLSWGTDSTEYLMTFDLIEGDWLFVDQVLYLVGDQTGRLGPSGFRRDVLQGGSVWERLFVPLSDEQLAFFQTDEPIQFSLRGSGGRKDVVMDDRFQVMLRRIVAAREFIDAGQPIPDELFEGFRRTD